MDEDIAIETGTCRHSTNRSRHSPILIPIFRSRALAADCARSPISEAILLDQAALWSPGAKTYMGETCLAGVVFHPIVLGDVAWLQPQIFSWNRQVHFGSATRYLMNATPFVVGAPPTRNARSARHLSVKQGLSSV